MAMTVRSLQVRSRQQRGRWLPFQAAANHCRTTSASWAFPWTSRPAFSTPPLFKLPN